jgi:Flp pilus assembly pilin Flp
LYVIYNKIATTPQPQTRLPIVVTLRSAIMGNFLSKFHKDEQGQGMTEYVIILVAIAVVCIAITVTFGSKIKALFETADAEIDTVDSSL